MPLHCSYSNLCSGCDWLALSRSEVEALRRTTLSGLGLDLDRLASPMQSLWIADGGLRHHLEFTLEPASERGPVQFGIYEKRGLGSFRRTLDLAGCPQLAPELEAWLREFRRDLPPLKKKSSVRLRVSPSGKKGIWIDTANEEIRDLLDESHWLNRQIEKGVLVEIGQRRKRVFNQQGPRPQLVDPVLEPWFETLDGHQLFGTIASFTQPGWQAAATLVRCVLEHIPPGPQSILEFGAGSGGFTLPLITRGHRVFAFEFDRLALSSLKRGAEQLPTPIGSNLRIFEGDFIQSNRAWLAAQPSLNLQPNQVSQTIALVDPPRSGLGKFLESWISQESELPHRWIYVSCYPESFIRDLALLQKRNYELEHLTIVEQFPYTNHFEIVASIVQKPN